MDTHRYIARFILEAETPLFVGSGEASLLKDALVQKDNNGFPMINGTSLAGVLRHAMAGDPEVDVLFGESNATKGKGSQLKVSSAYMVLNHSKVSEGIMEGIDDELLYRFSHLPARQHVRINDKGVAEYHGLFDNEVVYKGTRFVFEVELRGNHEDETKWAKIINKVKSPTFRIGSGTRNGYGSLRALKEFNRAFNLQDAQDLEAYINFDPSFNCNLKFQDVSDSVSQSGGYTKYTLALEPESFFIFSEGFGDEEADNRPLEEVVVVYNNDKIEFVDQTLIPASSIKGAISHRVAYHHNRKLEQYADKNEGTSGVNNPAVVALFGKAGKDIADPQAGKVYINDFYYANEVSNQKVFNHVAIDRFTGGAMDGALFSEKVSALNGGGFHFDVHVENTGLEEEEVEYALEEALKDICKGLLPLGGMTTKGHGVFTGKLFKNNDEIYSYE